MRYPSLGASTVFVEYQGRQRTIPTEIRKKGQTQESHYGNPLVSFWMPNWYGSGDGYVTFWLQEEALDALIRVQGELVAQDASLLLVDAYRDYQTQMNAYQSKPGLAIHPDQSNHTKGLAVDIRISNGDQNALEEAMGNHGWKRTVPKEPWHFDFLGGTHSAITPKSAGRGMIVGVVLGVAVLGGIWYALK